MSEPIKHFVLLQHTLSDSTHWDLMLDQGDALATWRLLDDPVKFARTAARPLGDHRRAYLDYEGPVSGNRGHVTRLDRGPYLTLERTPHQWRIHLQGSLLNGHYELLAGDNPQDAWIFQRLT